MGFILKIKHLKYKIIEIVYSEKMTSLKWKKAYVGVSSPECRSNSGSTNSKENAWTCGTVQIFGNHNNKKKCHSEWGKRRLISGNACWRSVLNLMPSRLPWKNIKIWIYKTIILPVVLYECDTWSLLIREEHRQWCLRKGCWRDYIDRRGMKWRGGWRKLHNEEPCDLCSSPSSIGITMSSNELGGTISANWGEEERA
jgi:hypothetical protein